MRRMMVVLGLVALMMAGTVGTASAEYLREVYGGGSQAASYTQTMWCAGLQQYSGSWWYDLSC